MNAIQIELRPETERILRQQAANNGETVESLLERIAENAASGVNGTATPTNATRTRAEWSCELRAWAASHKPVRHIVVDDRASIYEGRGE